MISSCVPLNAAGTLHYISKQLEIHGRVAEKKTTTPLQFVKFHPQVLESCGHHIQHINTNARHHGEDVDGLGLSLR